MRAAGIHHSLKDLSEEIGYCERQLSQVMKFNESQTKTRNNRSVSSSVIDRAALGLQDKTPCSISQQMSNRECCTYNSEETPSRLKLKRHGGKNVVCKETIKDRRGATQVQVVVHTKPSKRRSRSVQSTKTGTPVLNTGSESHNGALSNCSTVGKKNPSWSHILQQQNNVPSTGQTKQAFQQQKESTFQYLQSDNMHCNQLENWIETVPPITSDKRKPSKDGLNGHFKSSGKWSPHTTIFDPVRTLTFLVKELRGKVHKDCDENMLRIVEDMEQALHSISAESCQFSSNTQHTTKKEVESLRTIAGSIPARPRTSMSDSLGKCAVKPQVEADCEGVKSLIGILTSTVARMKNVATPSSPSVDGEPSVKKGVRDSLRLSQSTPGSFLQTEVEMNCKQLEETCRQMQEQCENLRQQRQQALEELQRKTIQLDATLGKNRQLTMYSVDVRQEMLRVQQAADIVQQENDALKKELLQLQHDKGNASNLQKSRLEEVLHENEQLSTELHLCQLEKEKLQILLSSKDLEVTKLKKEIVGISTLVSEQLTSLCFMSQPTKNASILDEIVQNINRFCEKSGIEKHIGVKTLLDESFANHVGEGEGNRTRPVCSSPTSSLNSSLYNSWQLSDISGIVDCVKIPFGGSKKEGTAHPSVVSSCEPENICSPALTDTKVKNTGHLPSNIVGEPKTDWTSSVKGNPTDLKAELQDMFHLLKKQAAEAVNVTIPSPMQKCSEFSDLVDMSHWTELSASESTLLHSSEDSQTD